MKKSHQSNFHQSVLLQETIKLLAVKSGQWYVDATVGGGGHTAEILKKGGQVLGIDWDSQALKAAKKHLLQVCPDAPWQLTKGNFANLGEMVRQAKLPEVSGVVFDLGVSSYQFGGHGRGFSFRFDEELDMRMDPETQQVTAKDLLAGLYEKELSQIFKKLVQEQLARPIAHALVLARRNKPMVTTFQLRDLVRAVYRGKRLRRRRIDPATKVFQALRMVVNDELPNLGKGLLQGWQLLTLQGRLVVISFHEGEDRLVKQQFGEWEGNHQGKVLTKKPIRPQEKEISQNPHCRSAKLRAIEKL